MDFYGLIGYPLEHSFSQKFFTEKFQKEGISARYLNFEIDSISDFPTIIAENPKLKGLNITIPYKEEIISYLDHLDDGAQRIAAVNTIKIIGQGADRKLIGYNTDVIGFQESLAAIYSSTVHTNALILGTGGASKAVAQALTNLNINYTFVSRSDKGDLKYSDLDEQIIKQHKLIINSSPVGTFPNLKECPAIDFQYLDSSHLLYDLVYNPKKTMFLTKGELQGAKIKNGYDMLVGQALAAWNIWNK